MFKKIIVANWKMNPSSREEAAKLFDEVVKAAGLFPNVEVVISPPAVFLPEFKKTLGDKPEVKLGAQDVFWEKKGAFTGQISPLMLTDLGVSYVIIGHSEKRVLGESSEEINKKIKAAFEVGLKPILCVGEPAIVRKRGVKASEKYVENQLTADLKGVADYAIIIAYEPIWAIGAGAPEEPTSAVEMASFIKKVLNAKLKDRIPKVLYGGSVDGVNVKNFLKYKELDGALVGGASLDSKEFGKLLNKTSEL